MTTLKPTEAETKQRAALLRSMTVTRMLDYGMDYWDATHLTNSPVSRPWHETAGWLADEQMRRATNAIGIGDSETAVSCYRRGVAALIFAQMEFNADTDSKRALYRRLSLAYQSAADSDTCLRIERLSIPHGASHCNGWLVRPRSGGPAPVVVIIGGQSGWGPAYHTIAEAFAKRGLAAVLLETPGQGESRMFAGLHLDAGVDDVFTTTLDVVAERTGYDGPCGVWGNSFGGLLAARAAVHDSRFSACCVNGATATPAPVPFRTAIEQSQAMLGVDTSDELTAILRTLWLDPAVDRTSAALLVLHGGADPLIALEQQEVFLGLSADSLLRVWGDGEHTIYNHAAERNDFACDWFRRCLTA